MLSLPCSFSFSLLFIFLPLFLKVPIISTLLIMQLRQLCCFWLPSASLDTFFFCVLTLRLWAPTPASLIKIILVKGLGGWGRSGRQAPPSQDEFLCEWLYSVNNFLVWVSCFNKVRYKNNSKETFERKKNRTKQKRIP